MNISKTMPAFFKTSTVAMSLLLGAGTVNAATVELDGITATAIKNLEVDFAGGAELYNVDFVETTAGSLYGNPPASTFPFSPVESGSVNDAILAALGGSAATSVGPDSASSELAYLFMYFSVEVDRGNVSFLGKSGIFSFGTGWVDNSPEAAGDTALGIYANFSPVPVPAAVWLFGSALVGLVGVARWRKQIA